MQTQRLRHRITIQRQVPTQDSDTGDVLLDWADVWADVPAEVLTGPGREVRADQSTVAETDLRVMFRWLPDVDQSMRVMWEGNPYDILSIELDRTARREIRLRCKTGATDGR